MAQAQVWTGPTASADLTTIELLGNGYADTQRFAVALVDGASHHLATNEDVNEFYAFPAAYAPAFDKWRELNCPDGADGAAENWTAFLEFMGTFEPAVEAAGTTA